MKPSSTIQRLALFLLAFSCESLGPEPDPCKDAEEFEADFSILENVGDSLVSSDNILVYSGVTFRAKGDYDSYEWRVGNDENTSTEKEYFLLFLEAEKNIEVRLIARKAASRCFPDDKTIDTAYHNFNVVPWKEAAILGRYVGSYDRTPHLTDTVEISYTATEANPDPFGEFKIVNINRGCDVDRYPHQACPEWTRGYRAFTIHTQLCKKCPGTYGIVKLIDDNTIRAEITYGDTTKWGTFPLPQFEDSFTGSRIDP